MENKGGHLDIGRSGTRKSGYQGIREKLVPDIRISRYPSPGLPDILFQFLITIF